MKVVRPVQPANDNPQPAVGHPPRATHAANDLEFTPCSLCWAQNNSIEAELRLSNPPVMSHNNIYVHSRVDGCSSGFAVVPLAAFVSFFATQVAIDAVMANTISMVERCWSTV